MFLFSLRSSADWFHFIVLKKECWRVGLPFQVLCNKDPQELKAGGLLHLLTIDDDGGVWAYAEVYSDFLCCPNNQGQGIVFAPSC